MMALLFRQAGHPVHETDGLLEILEMELPADLPFAFDRGPFRHLGQIRLQGVAGKRRDSPLARYAFLPGQVFHVLIIAGIESSGVHIPRSPFRVISQVSKMQKARNTLSRTFALSDGTDPSGLGIAETGVAPANEIEDHHVAGLTVPVPGEPHLAGGPAPPAAGRRGGSRAVRPLAFERGIPVPVFGEHVQRLRRLAPLAL